MTLKMIENNEWIGESQEGSLDVLNESLFLKNNNSDERREDGKGVHITSSQHHVP